MREIKNKKREKQKKKKKLKNKHTHNCINAIDFFFYLLCYVFFCALAFLQFYHLSVFHFLSVSSVFKPTAEQKNKQTTIYMYPTHEIL